jgi:hypothetical protein
VHAAGGTVDRRHLYRAAGVGYIVNGELGFAARIASLRRAAPRETPKAVVIAATEIPIMLMEVALAALFSFTLVAPLGLPWWTPLVGFCAVLAVVAGLARLARRHPSGWWRGVAALSEPRACTRVAVFVVRGQVARNWLMLYASAGSNFASAHAAGVRLRGRNDRHRILLTVGPSVRVVLIGWSGEFERRDRPRRDEDPDGGH